MDDTFEKWLRHWLHTGGGSCTATVMEGGGYKPVLHLDANTEGVGPIELAVIDNTVTMTARPTRSDESTRKEPDARPAD